MNRPQPRFTTSQKRDHVATLLRLGAGAAPSGPHVVMFAEQLGVRRETLYRWLRNPSLRAEGDAAPVTTTAPRVCQSRFEVDTNMLTVVAQEQSRLHAYQKLTAAGLVDVSYATFCRALDRMAPDVVAGALSGRKAMADNRVYLKKYVPHRCHTYFMDHTKLDVWVLPDHRSTTPIRPELTVIGDAYSGYVWAFVWYRPVRSEDMAAALASTGVERLVNDVPVGGVPMQLILDNAGQHFSGTMRDTCAMLGILMAPTNAYSSWQNGQAERAVQLVNRLVCQDAPGATRAGADPASTRFLESVRAKTDPASLWSAASLEARVCEVVEHVNTEIRRKDRGGMTRLELFDQDPTDRTLLTREQTRLFGLTTSKKTFRASKSGIQYRKRHFVAPELSPKHEYQIRYLPGVDEFIEVFDTSDHHVARAYNQESMPEVERLRLLSVRAAREREVRAVEESLKLYRRHAAAVDNADSLLAVAFDPLEDLPARDPHVDRSPKRKKLRRVSPTKPDPDESAATDHLYRQNLDSPTGQKTLTLIDQINASRKKDSRHD